MRTPSAGFAARAECLDWILARNRRHLEWGLSACVDHYNLGLEDPMAPDTVPLSARDQSSASMCSAGWSTSTIALPDTGML